MTNYIITGIAVRFVGYDVWVVNLYAIGMLLELALDSETRAFFILCARLYLFRAAYASTSAGFDDGKIRIRQVFIFVG